MCVSTGLEQALQPSAEPRQDEDAQNREHDAKPDLGREDVALRPSGHLRGVSPLRRKDEHRHERRNEREVIDNQHSERTQGFRLARNEREDGHIDLSRAERIEQRHEESAPDAGDAHRRAAPARLGHHADQLLHAIRQLERDDRRDLGAAVAEGVADAEERKHEKRHRQCRHHDIPHGLKSVQCLERPHQA